MLVRAELSFDKEPMAFLLCNIRKAHDQESLNLVLHKGNHFTPRDIFPTQTLLITSFNFPEQFYSVVSKLDTYLL